MNKTELIKASAERAGLTQKDTDKALEAILETIQAAVVAGDKVQVIGFGSFEPKDRKARVAINMQTKEKMTVPAKRVPAFKPGKQFKDAVDIKPAAKNKKKK